MTLTKGDAKIKGYTISTLSVEVEFVDAPAAVEPRKKPRKPPSKKALDKASSDNIEESAGEFTLGRVLSSFKNPRGACMHVHICTSMYGRPYMHAHTYTRI